MFERLKARLSGRAKEEETTMAEDANVNEEAAKVDETTAPRPPHSVSVTPFSGRVVWQVVFFGRRQLRRASLGSLVGVDGAAALFHPPLPARGFHAWETLPWRRLCERVS